MAKGEKWKEAPRIGGNHELACRFHMSDMAMRLVRTRAGLTIDEVKTYLEGDIHSLSDPYLMKGMREAVAILLRRARDGGRVRIIGDYDIDGVNSAYILLTAFKKTGINADTEIPHRIHDGYGINRDIITRAYFDGIGTLVTCDNGIAAAPEIDYAKSLGITVIVTDHHDVPFQEENGVREYLLPPADVIVNPKQEGCLYPFKKLCGAAVAWRLAECLYRESGMPEDEYLEFADCAAVATVGDVMDLEGENRIIVKYGLERLQNTSNRGYRALIKATGLSGRTLNTYHIGFVIGPCINASGRLDSAKKALDLLCSTSDGEAELLAGGLYSLNVTRKDLTDREVLEAIQLVEETDIGTSKVLVIYLEDCHESIAGIVAGKIRERFNRPCFVLAPGEDCVKGSGRSIDAYHMYDEMNKCSDLFIKFGGHPKAAGLSIDGGRIDEFRKEINDCCTLSDDDLIPVKEFDAILPIKYAVGQIINETRCLEPCGNGNRKPVFAASGLRVSGARLVGKNNNVLQATLTDRDGTSRAAVSFDATYDDLLYIDGRDDMCILYRPEINEFKDRRSVQLIVESFTRAEDLKRA